MVSRHARARAHGSTGNIRDDSDNHRLRERLGDFIRPPDLQIQFGPRDRRQCHKGQGTKSILLGAIKHASTTLRHLGGNSVSPCFRPGIIAGNAHTPRYAAWLGRLIPGPFGTIEQDDIARAFVAEFSSDSVPNGVVYFDNGAMRRRDLER